MQYINKYVPKLFICRNTHNVETEFYLAGFNSKFLYYPLRALGSILNWSSPVRLIHFGGGFVYQVASST